jgi:phosphoglycolate phosphatase-like HAD superfamily hydrolase
MACLHEVHNDDPRSLRKLHLPVHRGGLISMQQSSVHRVAIGEVFDHHLALHGGMTSLSPALYRPMAGAGARGMLGVAFGMTPEHAEYDAMKEEFFQNYERRMTVNTLAFDGVAEMLTQIQAAGLQWGIVTNKAARFTEPLTQAMTLLRNAATVISGDTTPMLSLTGLAKSGYAA